MESLAAGVPIFLFVLAVAGLAVLLLILGNVFNPSRRSAVKRMPYESGMNPIHDTHRRFDVRFHLLAIAFLVFDVELLFLYPWAVVFRPEPVSVERPQPVAMAAAVPGMSAGGQIESAGAETSNSIAGQRPPLVFAGGMVFIGLLTLGFVYDWRKGVFQWR